MPCGFIIHGNKNNLKNFIFFSIIRLPLLPIVKKYHSIRSTFLKPKANYTLSSSKTCGKFPLPLSLLTTLGSMVCTMYFSNLSEYFDIKFIDVTLVNNIIQISGVQLYNTVICGPDPKSRIVYWGEKSCTNPYSTRL